MRIAVSGELFDGGMKRVHDMSIEEAPVVRCSSDQGRATCELPWSPLFTRGDFERPQTKRQRR